MRPKPPLLPPQYTLSSKRVDYKLKLITILPSHQGNIVKYLSHLFLIIFFLVTMTLMMATASAAAAAAAAANNDEGDKVGGKVLLSIELV